MAAAAGERKPPVLSEDMSSVIVVDGIPVVEMPRFEKLCAFLRKFFHEFGELVDSGFYVPVESEAEGAPKKTCGYCFVQFARPEDARVAAARCDNKPLDKSHTIRVNLFTDLAKFAAVSEEFQVKAEEKVQDTVSTYVLDPLARDQYLVRFQRETEIYFNDPLYARDTKGRVLVNAGEVHKAAGKNWTEGYAFWSTFGSYLATFHQQGVALWAGDNFGRLDRFAHALVTDIDFSPNEKYMVTCNRTEKMRETDPDPIIIWDVRTGRMLKGMSPATDGKSAPQWQWPHVQWSHDDAYVATIGRDRNGVECIYVASVPSMQLVDKKAIRAPGVQAVSWSPGANVLAYCVPQRDNQPATVTLLEIPSKRVLREKHMYDVSDMRMVWQSQGHYLAVKVSKAKTKKTTSSNIEIFRVNAPDVPVETLELEDAALTLVWEPEGSRLAVAVDQNGKTPVHFYQMKKKKVTHLRTVTDRHCNTMHWSPQGDIVLLAMVVTASGSARMYAAMEFLDLDTFEAIGKPIEHYKCNYVAWDPTGRYVLTAATVPISPENYRLSTIENGYKIWSFDGKDYGLWACTTNLQLEFCYQVLWRPRGPWMLSRDERAAIEKTLKEKYWAEFQAEDERAIAAYQGAEAQRRQKLREQWRAYRLAFEAEEDRAEALRKGERDPSYHYETVEVWAEVGEVSVQKDLVPLEQIMAK